MNKIFFEVNTTFVMFVGFAEREPKEYLRALRLRNTGSDCFSTFLVLFTFFYRIYISIATDANIKNRESTSTVWEIGQWIRIRIQEGRNDPQNRKKDISCLEVLDVHF